MKKLLAMCLLLVLSNTALPQECVNTVNRYNGPNDSTELKTILYDTSSVIISGLDSLTKNSILTFMVFGNGMPVGFSGTDSSLTALHSNSNYASSVLGAILGVKVLICTGDTQPEVIDISLDEFNNIPGSSSFSSEFSECTNCYTPGGGPGTYGVCCRVGGNGCFDDYVIVDGIRYRIQ